MAEPPPSCRAAVITVSDSRAGGGLDDRSGDVIVERLRALPAETVSRTIVADSAEEIRAAVRACLGGADLIILTGGTGIGARDVTPQAIAPLLDYEIAGMAEVMRHEGMRSTSHAMLSRQVVGVADRRLVMALPGNPRAVAECLNAIWPALPHALELLRVSARHHHQPPPPA